MKIVFMSGGLANQMLQYIFARYIEETSGKEVILDDSFYFHGKVRNDFGLKHIFKIKSTLLSEYFDSTTWEGILEDSKKSGMYTYLKSHNPSLSLVAEPIQYRGMIQGFYDLDAQSIDSYYSIPYCIYSPAVSEISGDVYYFGSWLNSCWFYAIRDIILQELAFPEITDICNSRLRDGIQNTNSIGVHIRRGDYLNINCLLDVQFYRTSVTYLKSIVINPAFYIFSDDPLWCEKNCESLGLSRKDRIIFVKGNNNGNNYRDMQLMTYCKNLIIANSTFSFLASLLNQTPNKILLAPQKVYKSY